jgi:hypothetical protein
MEMPRFSVEANRAGKGWRRAASGGIGKKEEEEEDGKAGEAEAEEKRLPG